MKPQLEETKRPWREVVDEVAPLVRDDFYNPLVPEQVVLEERLPSGTAHQDFITNKTHMSEEFLDELYNYGNMDQETAVRGVYKHELGHYLLYPKECSKLMFLKHFSKGTFEEFKEEVVAYWVDVMDNLPQVLKKHRGHDIRKLYEGMYKVIKAQRIISPKEREWLESSGMDPEEIMETYHKYSVDRLLCAYYQIQGDEDMGIEFDDDYRIALQDFNKRKKDGTEKGQWESDEDKFLEEKLVDMMTLDFTNPKNELVNFVQFGTIVTEMLKKLKEKLPPQLGQCQNNDGVPADGQGEGYKILRKMLDGIISDSPGFEDFTDRQLEEGLDKIIRDWGKHRYEKIRKFVEEETGKKFDKPPQPKQGSKMAGLSSSDLQFHDDEIPYYERLARTYGLYIHRRPQIVDVTDQFPEGVETFRVGDKMKTLNPFSTGGRILPGITKKNKLRTGTKKDNQFKVPDLSVWIDSSGSMQDPKRGSNAILAAFVLGRNYWENEAKVGVVNFSTDTAFLPPTRDLFKYQSMVTAFWGGGTVLNVPKIKEYMERLSKADGILPWYTTETDYEKLMERLPADKQKEFLDKEVSVSLDRDIKETYQKIDNILITDGGIFNLEEVVEYMNSTAAMTRNVVFLIDNKSQYEAWREQHLPNTQIVAVEKAEDLLGLSIGEIKKMVPKVEKPASLFYQG